uniref:Uncharacterized protein n=1 Tax=Rhizophora mucronata TaxID=61149 RepID=A0A2P2QDW3_RHIMU
MQIDNRAVHAHHGLACLIDDIFQSFAIF